VGIEGALGDEFVEIANTGTAEADLSGWKLVYRSGTGTSDVSLGTLADAGSGSVLPLRRLGLLGRPPGRQVLLGGPRLGCGRSRDPSAATMGGTRARRSLRSFAISTRKCSVSR
jgi:hypothetical protein